MKHSPCGKKTKQTKGIKYLPGDIVGVTLSPDSAGARVEDGWGSARVKDGGDNAGNNGHGEGEEGEDVEDHR